MCETGETNHEPSTAGETAAHPAATLRLGHLYPDQLNVYGDRGNIIYLPAPLRLARHRPGIAPTRRPATSSTPPPTTCSSSAAARTANRKSASRPRERKGPGTARRRGGRRRRCSAVCGGYQLLGSLLSPRQGRGATRRRRLRACTSAPGKSEAARCVGNCRLRWNETTLTPASRTTAAAPTWAPNARPLGAVLSGFGNNGEDAPRGMRVPQRLRHLPARLAAAQEPSIWPITCSRSRSPAATARQKRRVSFPLDDTLEWQAHDASAAPRRRLPHHAAPSPHPIG